MVAVSCIFIRRSYLNTIFCIYLCGRRNKLSIKKLSAIFVAKADRIIDASIVTAVADVDASAIAILKKVIPKLYAAY